MNESGPNTPEIVGNANRADVVIVGAGPVGISLAIELGLRGRNVILLERMAARGLQPRAKTLNMRSLEHFRRWGVADAVRAASPLAKDCRPDIIFQTRLFGKHIATLPNIYFRGSTHDKDPRFCEASEWIPQYVVEDVLRARLLAMPNVEIRSENEFLSFSDDGSKMEVRARNSEGVEYSLEALYLVGADGARSSVRELCGIEMRGRYAFAANYNLVLRIPEFDHVPPRPRGLMHWIINADSPAIMGPIGDYWYLAKQLPPNVSSLSEKEIRDCVTGAAGREVDFKVISVDPWYAHELLADRYRKGRVFLAGDACHLHPPFGGYGMNMGIADAVDLGWKLDAVIAGWGGAVLLDSYEVERRRVHEWTIEEAIENYRLLSADLLRPGLEDDSREGETMRAQLAAEVVAQKRREFHTIGLVLGYHYGGSPIVACTDNPPAPEAEHYVPEVKCGALAPHIWLECGQSLYDRFAPGFTLLDTTGDADAAKALLAAAHEMGVPVRHLAIDEQAVIELYGRTLALIRPDQHIAWTGDEADIEAAGDIWKIVSGWLAADQRGIAPAGNMAQASLGAGKN